VSDTRVKDFSAVSQFTKLKVLKADRCKIESIKLITECVSLEKLFLDETGVNDINAQEFLLFKFKMLTDYKTVHLNRWWRSLSENWKAVFKAQMKTLPGKVYIDL